MDCAPFCPVSTGGLRFIVMWELWKRDAIERTRDRDERMGIDNIFSEQIFNVVKNFIIIYACNSLDLFLLSIRNIHIKYIYINYI